MPEPTLTCYGRMFSLAVPVLGSAGAAPVALHQVGCIGSF